MVQCAHPRVLGSIPRVIATVIIRYSTTHYSMFPLTKTSHYSTAAVKRPSEQAGSGRGVCLSLETRRYERVDENEPVRRNIYIHMWTHVQSVRRLRTHGAQHSHLINANIFDCMSSTLFTLESLSRRHCKTFFQ